MPEPTYYIAGLFRQANDTLARSYLKISTGAGGVQAISAGVNSTSSGTVVFSNANNVSFGMNGAGVVTAIANTVGGGAITNILFSAGTYSTYRSDITFDNSNGVTFGQDTAGVITATVRTDYQSSGAYLTTAALSQDSSKYAGTGFTTATTAGTNIVGTLNTAGLSMGIPAYLTTASAGGITAINLSAGTTSSNISAFTFSNGSGVTFGFDGSNVTASVQTNYQSPGAYLTTAMASDRGTDFVQATAGFHGTNASGTIASSGISVSVAPPTAVNINISAGTTSSNVSAVTFSNANGISWGYDGSNITGTVATNYQSSGAYLTTAMASDASSAFAGTSTGMTGGSVTLNTSGIAISLPAYLTTFAFPRLDQVLDPTADKLFSMGSNQLQLSWATGGSFSTNATRQGFFELDLAGNVTQEADVIHAHQHGGAPTKLDMLHVEGDGANVTGLRLQMSATVAAEVNQPIKFTTADTGYSIGSVPMILGTGMSNSVANLNANFVQGRASSQLAGLGFTTATTAGTAVVGTLSTNGLSMGVPAFLTTAQASGNYAGTATSVVTTSGTDLTFALNTNGETIAYPKWITTYVNDLTSGRAGTGFTTTSTAGTALVGTLDTNGISMGVPAWLTAANVTGLTNFKISAGASSSLVSAVTFNNSNGVSFGYDGTNITASIATVASSGLGGTISYFANFGDFLQTSTTVASSNSFCVFPFTVFNNVSASYLRLSASIAFVSTTIATSAVNNVTGASTAFSETIACNAVLYTAGTGASSRSLQYIFSTSAGITWSCSVSQQSTTNASRQTIGQSITFPNEGNTTDNVNTGYSVSVTNGPISTTQWSLLSAYRYLDIPFATLLTPGVYWMALNKISGSVGGKNNDINISTFGRNIIVLSFGNINSALNTTNYAMPPGLGMWTTNVAQTTSSIGLNAVNQSAPSAADLVMPFMMLIRQA